MMWQPAVAWYGYEDLIRLWYAVLTNVICGNMLIDSLVLW